VHERESDTDEATGETATLLAECMYPALRPCLTRSLTDSLAMCAGKQYSWVLFAVGVALFVVVMLIPVVLYIRKRSAGSKPFDSAFDMQQEEL